MGWEWCVCEQSMLTFRRLLSSDVIIANRRLMSSDVIIANRGSVAHFTLNRPKALNALTLPMVRNLNEAYAAAVANPEIHCILMDGAGGKAFCAGGDVKSVWDAARPGAAKTGLNSEPYLPDAFFREEYALNAAIAGCPKPQVSIWDGFVMGGGAGVSVHGAYRVATERAAFAMPETNIGIFPDVGGSYFLSKLPGELGTYIGLTGTRLSAADLLYCGLASHHVPSAALPELVDALSGCKGPADVANHLARLGEGALDVDPSRSSLARDRNEIDSMFAGGLPWPRYSHPPPKPGARPQIASCPT